MTIERIGIAGAGVMGTGIAQAAAQAGFAVTLYDTLDGQAQRAINGILAALDRLVDRGRLGADERAGVASRLGVADSLAALADNDLIIEAVFENLAVKQAALRELDAAAPPACLLASNTSTLPITELASATAHPERVIGMHFFNPVHAMKLVEVIRGEHTSDAAVEAVRETALRLGKTPVTVRDNAGFVANRLLGAMINEAIIALTEGLAAREDIDAVMRLGANHPMGPLELADLIGLDVCLDLLETLHRAFGDKYRPAPMLRRMVAAGQLGRKSGQGFYSYR